MTAEPETVQPLVPVDLGLISPGGYRAYPLVDHIADKVYGLMESHPRLEGPPEPSSRYRDLADLAVFAHTAAVEVGPLLGALKSEAKRRGLVLPKRMVVPATPDWVSGYRRVAREAPNLQEREVQEAIETVSRFLDPVLSGEAQGRWDPEQMTWS